MKNTDHVVFDSAAAGGHCLHCDTREPAYKLPMSIPDFVARSTKFIEAHKDCPVLIKSTMPDYAELKRAAAAFLSQGHDPILKHVTQDNYFSAADPATVLEIIDRMERAVDAMNADTVQELSFRRRAIEAESQRDELLDTMRCFASGQYDESEVQDMAKTSIEKVGAA